MLVKAFFSSAQRLLAATAIATVALGGMAQAAVVTSITYSPNGLPAATGPINSIDFTAAYNSQASSFTVNSGPNAVTVTLNGGKVVQGSVSNQYAAPISGGTAANPITYAAPYLSTGGVPNTITLSFATPESYLGLLWGSIGVGDLLTFYDASQSVIATVSGTQAQQAASGFGGSQYTLVNLIGGQFSSVKIEQTSSPSFEAAAFQYAAQNVSVPEPASLTLVGAGLVAAGLIRRRRKSV